MNILEKNNYILKHIKNKILLSNSRTFFVILRDFLTDDISIPEIVTVINRLKYSDSITVTDAGRAENDRMTINNLLPSIFNLHERDLSDLSRNELYEDHTFKLSIKVNFLDELKNLNIDSVEMEVLTRILADEFPVTFPLKIFCPIDRSGLCEIEDEKEWMKIQSSFSNGEIKKCTNRCHSCIFHFQNGEMVIKVAWDERGNNIEKIDDKNKKR